MLLKSRYSLIALLSGLLLCFKEQRDCNQTNKESRTGELEEGLFIRASSDRTRGNSFEQKEGRHRLDIWKFFTVRVASVLRITKHVVSNELLMKYYITYWLDSHIFRFHIQG